MFILLPLYVGCFPHHPHFLQDFPRNSLVVQGIGLCSFTAECPGSIPDWGLRSRKPCSTARKKRLSLIFCTLNIIYLSRVLGFVCLSCLVFSELLRPVVWCLSLILERHYYFNYFFCFFSLFFLVFLLCIRYGFYNCSTVLRYPALF